MGTYLQHHLVFQSETQSALNGLFDLSDQFIDLDPGGTRSPARPASEAQVVVEFECRGWPQPALDKRPGEPYPPSCDHRFTAGHLVCGADGGAPAAPHATVGLKIEFDQSLVTVQHLRLLKCFPGIQDIVRVKYPLDSLHQLQSTFTVLEFGEVFFGYTHTVLSGDGPTKA